MVRYADDMVILCYSKKNPEAAVEGLRVILEVTALKVTEAKSKIVHIRKGLDLLVFNFQQSPKDRYWKDDIIFPQGDGSYNFVYEKTLLIMKSSDKSIKNFRAKIKKPL
jgi:hypothetical protein